MGAALSIRRDDQTAAKLRAVAARCGDGAQVRRILAIALVLEGGSRTEAARQTGMDRQTLRDWVRRYNEEGIDGLKSRSAPGRVAALSEPQMTELKALVINGPDPAEHKVVRWRCADLREEIALRFSVEVHESTVGKWLRQLGLTRLQPRPFHPKKNAEAQQVFKTASRIWCEKRCSNPPPAPPSRFGFKTKREWARKAVTPMSGRQKAPAHPWCAMSVMTPPTCSARSALSVVLVLRSSCRRSIPKQ